MSDPHAELQSTLRDLSIGEKGRQLDIARPIIQKSSLPGSSTSTPKPRKAAREPVADSWEDEAEELSDLGEETNPNDISPPLSLSTEGPLDPPPTPISPQTSHPYSARAASPAAPAQTGPARRPEKQTAVAGRMIAGALGIRAPKQTEDQRAYDRAVKEQELRRRNREREELAKAKEEEERLKAAVWND